MSKYIIIRPSRAHLNFEDRLRLEKRWNSLVEHHPYKTSIRSFCKACGISTKLWRRELKRCDSVITAARNFECKKKDRVYYQYPLYDAVKAQADADRKKKNKGPQVKLKSNIAKEISHLIRDEKMSPYTALETVKKAHPNEDLPCEKTIYNNINAGDLEVKRGETPYHPGRLKKKRSKAHEARTVPGRNQITSRPEEANNRSELGHWEMDTVVSCLHGTGGLLVFYDRLSRKYLIEKIAHIAQADVLRAIGRLHKRNAFGVVKTVTTDNGCEFLNQDQLEKKLGCKVYYTRAFASYEKGGVENANRILRRWYPKGTDFKKIPKKDLAKTETTINNMPRKSLKGKSANENHTSVA